VVLCGGSVGDGNREVFGRLANLNLTQNSTANTALSLDGKGSTGQSVGQHVCTG